MNRAGNRNDDCPQVAALTASPPVSSFARVRRFAAALLLFSIVLVACGGSDEGGGDESFDTAAFQSCLQDVESLTVETPTDESDSLDELEAPPALRLQVTPPMGASDLFPIPVEVYAFDKEADADAAAEAFGGNQFINVHQDGPVVWLSAELENGITEKTQTALRDCVAESG